MEENNKEYISEKSILECPENHRRLVEEDQIYKIENFDSVFSTDEGPIGKENSIWGEIQNWMLKDSIRNFQGLVEFIEGLIEKEMIFEVILGFNWKKLKSEGSNCNF